MPSATFPTAARLHRPTEFSAALSGRRVARGVYFVLSAKVVVSTEPLCAAPPIARLGLIMAKRFAADYVVRLNRRIESVSLSALKRAARQEADAHFVKASQC